jgi:hypothetical protein
MKITKLNGRYKAHKQWGFGYSVAFDPRAWKKYYAFITQLNSMFGKSREIPNFKFIWREDVAFLKQVPWAYSYIAFNDKKPKMIYFRTEEQMNQAIVMFALSNQE